MLDPLREAPYNVAGLSTCRKYKTQGGLGDEFEKKKAKLAPSTISNGLRRLCMVEISADRRVCVLATVGEMIYDELLPTSYCVRPSVRSTDSATRPEELYSCMLLDGVGISPPCTQHRISPDKSSRDLSP